MERMPDLETTPALGDVACPPKDVEFVLGQRQVASVLFVAIVLLAVFCTVAYVAGRSVGTRAVIPAAPAQPVPVRIVVAPPAPPKIVEVPAHPTRPNLSFASTDVPAPHPGDIYLQIGAVERGFAEVLVVGLRAKGFPSVMTPAPGEKIFRVLIGPLNDSAAYARAKSEMGAAGLNFFPRRYQISPESGNSSPPEDKSPDLRSSASR
jgi:cell division septation protein DedD